MATVPIGEMRAALGKGRRLLGLDVGSKTIGLALSDPMLTVASPIVTVRRTRLTADLKRLAEIVAEREVGGFVVGLPISMNGTEGPRCQSVRQFAADLLKAIDLPLAFWDERLSTAAVERVLIDEADMSRKRRAEVIDKMAAAYLLQGALDAMRVR